MLRIFPPKASAIPDGYWRNGYSKSFVKSCWGEVTVNVQRLKRKDGKQTQVYCDSSLDSSGWSPEALERLLDLVGELPYETASSFATKFGLSVSSSSLERLSQPYLATCQKQLQAMWTDTATTRHEPSTAKTDPQRLMVLQTDGTFVLKRPENGHCEGMEIKSAVLYPQNAPHDRVMLADGCSAEEFLPLLAGLTKRFCTPHDVIIGIGDGAGWVEEALDTLTDIRITDVFHSCQYLEIMRQELGWNEAKRTQHRQAWCKGDSSAQHWLSLHLPLPDQRHDWSDQANAALDYFTARLDHMDYPAFKAKGYPIGSGQVEAMNKNVIGNRLKRSGMHWSKQGASAMAATRALIFSKFKLCSFDQLRFLAYAPLSSP
jgi:hypothetical protein